MMTHISPSNPSPNTNRGFTIIELLVVVSIIGLLLAILVPAVSKARDSALVTQSQGNLRNLAAACTNYGAAWGDRQLTLMVDDFAQYCGPLGPNAPAVYYQKTGACLPPLVIGWGGSAGNCMRATGLGNGGLDPSGKGYWGFWYPCNSGNGQWSNYLLSLPMITSASLGDLGTGIWRIPNVNNFNQYVGGKFYDRTFYAPKDKLNLDRVAPAFEKGDSFTNICGLSDSNWVESSYAFSPAGMYSPDIFSNRGCQKFTGVLPPATFRSPPASASKFPELKTRMIEVGWLQNREGPPTNQALADAIGEKDENYFFNQSMTSAPVCMFYDAHIGTAGASDSMDGHTQAIEGNSTRNLKEPGLFLEKTLGDLDGTWGSYGGFFTGKAGSAGAKFNYDPEVNTSYHVFTTDGILGRDFMNLK